MAPTHPDYTRDRYTLAHAAVYLTVSAKFLYGLVAAKRIACARLSDAKNAKVLFNQAALDRYAATRRRPTKEVHEPGRRPAPGEKSSRWDLG